jgi:putative transposase
MMTENTQCVASALRNSILNLGLIPKVVYQDNGKAFKFRYFQHSDFEEGEFNGVYANLGIHSVFTRHLSSKVMKAKMLNK